MEIHIWDLLKMNNARIVVNIKESLRNKIRDTIRENIYPLSKELDTKPARLYEYFIWRKSLIPLDILLNLSNKIKIPKEEIEKSIVVYKQLHVPGKNSIKNPKLPIEINPYFTSIIANLFFDGSIPKDGKGTYYNQKNRDIMADFIKKVNYVFGEVFYSLKLDHRGVLKCRIPRIIGEICKYVYNVNSFGTFDARVPLILFNLDNKHKESFVLTAIIDEGSITYDGQITFGVCNKKLCEDVKKLCNEIGLETTFIKQTSKNEFYYFYIKSKKKLLDTINSINKKYPLISLRYKEERLRSYFKIITSPGLRTKKFGDLRKKIIFKSLKEGQKSINQLAKKLLILPRSLRRHLKDLMKYQKVKKEKIGNEYIYSLTQN